MNNNELGAFAPNLQLKLLAAASSGILLPVANNILAALNSTKVELMLYIVVRQQYTALIDL